MASDYYSVLNVSRDASAVEVRTAYRKRVRELHPDLNPDPNTAMQFTELTTAYAVLKDPAKRAAFDQLTAPAPPSDPQPPAGESLFDKIADAADAVLQGNPLKPEMSEEEKSFKHLENMRTAISHFYELPVAADTCRAFLLAAVYEEPARSASMDAVTHLYLEHEDARAVTVSAAPPDASTDAIYAVTAAIISGAAVEFVERGLLTTDPPLGTVDHSTQTINEVATDRLAATFAACDYEPLPRSAL